VKSKKAIPAQVQPVVRPEYFEAKENPMFSPEITKLIRFARYPQKVPCEVCGKKVQNHWTMITPFRAFTLAPFVLVPANKIFKSLTPVCLDHQLSPVV